MMRVIVHVGNFVIHVSEVTYSVKSTLKANTCRFLPVFLTKCLPQNIFLLALKQTGLF